MPRWWRTSRAQAGLHVLIALLVALAVAASVVVPRLAAHAADAEFAEAIADAGKRADVVVTFPWEDDSRGGRELAPDSAGALEDIRDEVAADVPGALIDVLGPPVTVITSGPVKAGVVDARPILARFAYLAGDGVAEVTWIEGSAPGAGPSGAALAEGEAPVIEVGVSADVAAAWDVKPGDERLVGESLGVRVSGVFAAVNADAAGWEQVPQLLHHQAVGGSEPRIDVALLLGPESLPYALYALGNGAFTRAFVMSPLPEAITVDSASRVAVEARGLSSGRNIFSYFGRAGSVSSSLDRVLDEASGRTDAAHAQATVMLAGVLAAAVLAIILAGEALARRRASLAQLMRKRGASRSRIATVFGVEAAVVSVGAGAVGWAGGLVVPGHTPWWVVLPVIAGIVAPAVAVTHVAHAATPRAARGFGIRRRRVAVGALVMFTALMWGAALGAKKPPAAVTVLAPVATSVLIALVVVWAVPWLAATWKRWAHRRRGAAGLIASANVLAPVAAVTAVVTGCALVAVVTVANESARTAGERASWEVVGADAVVTSLYGAPLPAASDEIAAGASEHTVATVKERVQVFDAGFDASVTVVVVDPVTMARVITRASGQESREFTLLTHADDADAIPVLALGVPDRDGLTLRWEGRRIAVDVVGEVPELPPGIAMRGSVLVVPRAALAQASGAALGPTHVWLNGDGAAEAAAALAASDAEVTVRSEWVEALTASPVAKQGASLTVMTVALAAAITLVSVTMWCIAGSAARSRMLARMAVLGFPARYRRRTALANAAGTVAITATVGVGAGVFMASALVTALGLDALAGGAHVVLVVPWWLWVLPVLCTLVAAAASLRGASVGPYRLGSVLREG